MSETATETAPGYQVLARRYRSRTFGEVVGQESIAETLERATDLSTATLLPALDELEWQRWLAAEPRGYAFVARVVRNVVARDMLTPGQRQRIQAAAGLE